ncbi:TPA: hypothetical protein ACH3X1_015715 [Trebouxia sp. C0004]
MREFSPKFLVEQDLTDEVFIAFVNEDPADSDSDSDVEEEFAEEITKAPSSRDAQGLGCNVQRYSRR